MVFKPLRNSLPATVSRKPSFQRLEDRTMMALDVFVRSDVLRIEGSGGADVAIVEFDGGHIEVRYKTGSKPYVTESFDKSDVESIRFEGKSGNDRFENNTTRRSLIFGDGGHDKLSGGEGRDVIRGGSGNDVLRGRGNKDDLRGDDGRDALYGGSGKDQLRGGTGNDSLFGGQSGGAAADQLYGQSGDDRFLVEVGDQVRDRHPDEALVHFRKGREYSRTQWKQREIEVVDEAFGIMYRGMGGSNALLRDALTGKDLIFEHAGYE